MHQAVSSDNASRGFDDATGLTGISVDFLYAELKRRSAVEGEKPQCGSTGNRGSYNTLNHVLALVLIFALSTFACSLPIIVRRFPKLPIPHRFLFLSRHFGTGVLIATAFIHLLPTAFISLIDPCLPDFWNKTYPQMAGLIAMTSVFLVVTIEMIFASRGAGHTHSSDWDQIPSDAPGKMPTNGGQHYGNGHIAMSEFADSRPNTEGPIRITKQRPSGETDAEDDDEEDDFAALDGLDPADDAEAAYLNNPGSYRPPISRNRHSLDLSAVEANPQKAFLQCLLLEAGILFHSIFIGMAVSVATGTQFVVLLIAICFHQTFEGFALGARIAALIPALFDARSPKPWLMALAYGSTTPIGQAIGIWMHRLYDPASQVGLLMVGITNAVSSGLLLFAGLVQLLSEDFLSDHSYETLRGRRRIEAGLAVALGGILMALVGAFA